MFLALGSYLASFGFFSKVLFNFIKQANFIIFPCQVFSIAIVGHSKIVHYGT